MGVPQLSAIIDAAVVSRKLKIPIIADGGVRNSGDLSKAIAAGASTAMLGSLFAGTDEAAGEHITKAGIRYKHYRGMASSSPAHDGFHRVPEGVAGIVPYRGKAESVISDLASGLRSALSYLGACTISEFQQNAEFVQITRASLTESYAHDMKII